VTRSGGRRSESVRGLELVLRRVQKVMLSKETSKDAVLQGIQADDGTRTHGLLHGKSWRPFAPVRSRSPKPAVCGDFVERE
jgi:hypothetical protein